jgi:hypothetical protein
MLAAPELYNLALDPGESYCVASLHSEIVAARSHELDTELATFPQSVQDAYALLKRTVTNPNTPVGLSRAWPESPGRRSKEQDIHSSPTPPPGPRARNA